MRGMRPADELATPLGPHLARSQVLLRGLPARQGCAHHVRRLMYTGTCVCSSQHGQSLRHHPAQRAGQRAGPCTTPYGRLPMRHAAAPAARPGPRVNSAVGPAEPRKQATRAHAAGFPSVKLA
jgi:hypothetical protein